MKRTLLLSLSLLTLANLTFVNSAHAYSLKDAKKHAKMGIKLTGAAITASYTYGAIRKTYDCLILGSRSPISQMIDNTALYLVFLGIIGTGAAITSGALLDSAIHDSQEQQ